MASFKLYFSDTNIRRISTDIEKPTYEQFTDLLCGLYPDNYHPELYVRWKDEEGDLIIASSEQEWNEMLSNVHERPIKLYVTEGMTPYFKDGPPAEPQYFYTENAAEEPKEKPEFLQRLKNTVPQCLQKLFQGGRILPDNIPAWLKEAVHIKRRMGADVDLDIDIPKLWNAMHTRALDCLKDAKNTKLVLQARQLLEDMLEIIPKHAITLYNLSCAESLLGNSKQAILRLRDAIVAGYKNFEHMMKDEDLENIRNSTEFQEMLQKAQAEVNEAQDACEEDDMPELVDNFQQVSKQMDDFEDDDDMPELECAVSAPLATSMDSEDEFDWSSSSSDDSDWTQVDSQMDPFGLEQSLTQSIEVVEPIIENKPVPEPVSEPVVSVGEQKWTEAIDLLKAMGFGEGPYFGPRCVVLLEKHNGDLPSVINDLLN